ncbi:MAG: N-acetylmuramoyl-L-alanine amidase [Acidobacteriota bacterium]
MSEDFRRLALDRIRERDHAIAPPPNEIVKLPSPWFTVRPGPVQILVLHAMGEWVARDDGFQHCTDLLYNLGLSVHALCLPDGRIVECVAAENVAYHAGPHNATSVGMEIVVAGAHNLDSLYERIADVDNPPFRPAQYESAGWWFRKQANRFDLDFSAIKTHAELDPQRKRDPGAAFDLEAFRLAFDNARTG